VVPVVLVEGVPVVLTPGGVRPTAVTGATDPLWWPGNGALEREIAGVTVSPVRDWLETRSVWEVFRAVDPVRGEVREEALAIDLVGGQEVVRAIAAPDAAAGWLLVGNLLPGATRLALNRPVTTTGGVIAHLGREAVVCTAVAGDSALTVVSRGAFGSSERWHRNDPRTPLLIVIAPLTDPWPRSWHGRVVTVWTADLVGSTLIAPRLWHAGVVGAGTVRNRTGLRWTVTIDPISQAIRRRFAPRTITITGIAATAEPLVWVSPYPRIDLREIALWYPDWSSVCEAWTRYAQSVGLNARASLQGGRVVVAALGLPPDSTVLLGGSWSTNGAGRTTSTGVLFTDLGRPPPVLADLRGYPVPVTRPGDAAQLPTVLVHTVSEAVARYALVGERVRAPIVAVGSTGGIPWVRCEAPPDTRLITERTELRLVVVARGPAIDAIRAAAAALDHLDGGTTVPLVDWSGIERMLGAVPLGAIPAEREFELGDRETLFGFLRDELLLRGCTLAVRRGRITAVRVEEIAVTDNVTAEIGEADCVVDGQSPVEPELSIPSPVATAVRYRLPAGREVVWVDATHRAEFGEGEELECRALERVPGGASSAALDDALAQSAQQVLGVLAQPVRVVRVSVPAELELAEGDRVRFSHPRVPDTRGNLGVAGVSATVIESRYQRWGGRWRAELALRLSDAALSGYAPEALVAPAGIDGSLVSIDTASDWGASGFAQTGRGPLDGFAVGDRVALVQLARDPIPAEVFTVVALTADTLELDGAPSAAMVAAAGARYGVLVRWQSWGAITTRQRQWLYCADYVTGVLGAGDPPRRWAG
jgi:hypothetical protein